MRIELRPVLEHPEAGGLVDGQSLTVEGRDAYAGGRPIALEEIGDALAAAVEAAASALWGSDYLGSLSRVSGLNRRSVVSDRIARNDLPGWLLSILAYVAEHPTPRALGYLMLAAAEVLDATDENLRADLAVFTRQGLEDALTLVERARNMKRVPARTR